MALPHNIGMGWETMYSRVKHYLKRSREKKWVQIFLSLLLKKHAVNLHIVTNIGASVTQSTEGRSRSGKVTTPHNTRFPNQGLDGFIVLK